MATISADKDDRDCTERVHVICSYSGLKLLYFEHCYCRNSASLFETYVNDKNSESEVMFLEEVKSTSKISKVVTHEVEKLLEAIPTPATLGTTVSLTSPVLPSNSATSLTSVTHTTLVTPVVSKTPTVPATAVPVFLDSPILSPTPIFSTSTPPPTPETPADTVAPPIPETPTIFRKSPILSPTPIIFSTSGSTTPRTSVTPASITSQTPVTPANAVAHPTPETTIPATTTIGFFESPVPIIFSTSASITPSTPVTPPTPVTSPTSVTPPTPETPSIPATAATVFHESPILSPTTTTLTTITSANAVVPLISETSSIPVTLTTVSLESAILSPTSIIFSSSTTPLTTVTPANTVASPAPETPTVPATAVTVCHELPMLTLTTPPTPVTSAITVTPPTPATSVTTEILAISAAPVFLESPILSPTPIIFSTSTTPSTPVAPVNTKPPKIPMTAATVCHEPSMSTSTAPPTPVTPASTVTPPTPPTSATSETSAIQIISAAAVTVAPNFHDSTILSPKPIIFSTSTTTLTPATPANTELPEIPSTFAATDFCESLILSPMSASNTPASTVTSPTPATPVTTEILTISTSPVSLESLLISPNQIIFSTSNSSTSPTPVIPGNTVTPPTPLTSAINETPEIPATVTPEFLGSQIISSASTAAPSTSTVTETPAISAVHAGPVTAAQAFVEFPIFSITTSTTTPIHDTPGNTVTPLTPAVPTNAEPPKIPATAATVFRESPILVPTLTSTIPPTSNTPANTVTPPTSNTPVYTEISVKNTTIRGPVRRSPRQINKPEKDNVVKDALESDKGNSQPNSMQFSHLPEQLGKGDNLHATNSQMKNKYSKRELKNAKDISVKKKIIFNYETEKQISPSKILKKYKLPEVRVVLEETSIHNLKQKLPEKYKLDNLKYKEIEKKIDINVLNTEVRRKRTYSEPSKNDSSDLAVVKEDIMEKKRLRSLTKQLNPGKKSKKNEKFDSNPRIKRRKRNISTPSDKIQVCKSSENLEMINKGKRKKHSPLCNETVSNEDNKIEKKDVSSESKEPEFKGPSFPCTVVKAKPKKIARRESLRLIINEDEPPLFSQPDVLVKVKSDEHSCKKEEKQDFDDKTHNQNILSNIKHTATLVSASATSIEPVELKNSVINLKQKDISPEIHTASIDLKAKEINQNSTIYSIKEQNLFDDFDTKDIDSENSLQIDESVGRNEDSKEVSDDNSCNKVTESLDDSFSACSKNKNIEANDFFKKEVDENLSKSKQPSFDLDSDKPIAERKPRRTIKKKEFFEDIASRSEVLTRKSGRQRLSEKKSLDEEDSKLGKNTKQKLEVESDTDESSEDDPEKLWCICRKPHNDRFMIQCDNCEDWFHGSCVGVTRQLGRKLEKQKKEWNCPNCLSKEPEVSNTASEKIPEKEIAADGKKVKTTESKELTEEKPILSKSVTLPMKKEKEVEKIVRPPQKSNSDPKISSVVPKSMLPTIILNKKIPKIIKSTVKESASPVNDRKIIKEVVKKKLNCITCQAPAITHSSYCSEKCIEKHAADCLSVMRDVKGSMKASEFDCQKVVVLDCLKGNVITGDNAPSAGEIVSWLKTNPSYMIACSSNVTTSLKKESGIQKRDPDPTLSAKESKEISDEASKTVVRFNVRKTLRNILLDRCKNADDVQLAEEDIRKIAVKIEEELYSLFKDNSFKYRAKYRSLMFNIKDPRNQGLFRKILKGSIPPDKLVRMSPEELASVELAKWREQENQHLLDMIKRVQLEQQSGSCLLKKTHKGEVEIEDDLTDIIEDVPKVAAKVLSEEPVEFDKSELEKVIVKDTTHLHRSHLFNLNCKICTGKIVPPPVEDSTPKKVRVAHSISVDISSSDVIEKNVSKEGKSPLSSTGDDSLDQEPTSTVSIGSPEICVFNSDKDILKAASSVWKGFIYMQDVAKFVTSAYKVSGHTEHLHVDVPDTIQVCGRIIPDQVWDYLGKIKQSGSKELIIIRFQAANDEEAVTYNSFYSYLSSRKRYGVVSNYSKKVKDFYILPLAATSPVPMVLMPFNGPGLPSPRPHLLLGVIVRHKAKQSSVSLSKKEKYKDEIEKKDGSYTPPLDNRSYTPPLPLLTNENSSNVTHEAVYNPSLDLKSMTVPNVSEIIENSTVSCSDVENKDIEIYEPSYTPPLQISADCPKEIEDEKPYDPEQDVLIIESDKKESISSPKENIDSTSSENLEKHKQILDALTRQVEETDRQVNALKQLISQPDDSDAETDSPGTQRLDINSVTASGMSSFLDLPENLQDILNVVREKSHDKGKSVNEKCDVDMRISELFSKSLKTSGKINIQDKGFSQGATPPPDDNEEVSSVMRPSDPRIKLRTSFQEASYTPEEPANFTLKNMSESELVERAKQQLAEMEALETVPKTQKASTSHEKLSNLGKISNWHQFKEPPPPGIELADLAVQDNSYSSKTTASTASDSSLSSSFTPSLIPNSSQIATHFPPPSAFPPHLPPGFSIQTPPPNIKNFPPPNVISTSFPPPPLPLVSKASDVNPVNETWPSWNVPSQDRVPHWKHDSDNTSVDCSESSSHYYTTGTQEFQNEQFYRSEPSSERRWSRPPQRFPRNNWNKRPRGSRWRGRRLFHFNKIQRN